MTFQFVKPSGILSQFVKHYWVLEADASEGIVGERVIPTGNVQLMFHYKKTFIVNKALGQTEQPRTFVSGISGDYADVFTQGDSGVIAVTFYPYGACNFFRFPLTEIEDLTVNLDDIYSNTIKSIEDKICTKRTLKEKISVIEEFLIDRFKPIADYDIYFLKNAVLNINEFKGRLNALQLANKLSITGKSLERKFSSLLGKTPKQFIKIVRFQEVIKSFSTLKNKSLTELAFENGYFDQAHFIKDFKSMSGFTPKEYLTRYPCKTD